MNEQSAEIAALILSLKSLKGIGNKTIIKLLQKKKELILSTSEYNESFLEKLDKEKNNKESKKTIEKAIEKTSFSWKEALDKSNKVIERCIEEDIYILHPFMEQYPKRLLFNDSYPPILFAKGDINILNSERAIAIIGTREPTDFGLKFGRRVANLLAKEGYVIVSGLAIGSDTIGHLGALDEGGKTVAVLPTPIDAPVYPKENEKLAEDILNNGGVLVSEYAPGTTLRGRALINNLVARDEWQPGLSDGVLIVETSTTGGTNHAARHAIKTNTPLAAFDYTEKFGDVFLNEERFSGNVKYIKANEADPIYFKESLDNFKAKMNEYYKKKISNINKFHRLESEVSEVKTEQMKFNLR